MTTYTFNPPTVLRATPGLKPEFLSRYKWKRGIGLYRDGVGFLETEVITEAMYGNGKVDGVDYFRGGYVYTNVSEEVAELLTLSGYGDGLEPEE